MDYYSAELPSIFFLGLFSITPGAQTLLLLVSVFLFMIAFLMSGSEVAFFTLTSKEVNILKTHKNPSFRRIVNLLEHPRTLQASMRIANNFSKIALILIFNMLLDTWALDLLNLAFVWKFLIKIASITFLIVLFADMLPRIWATHHKVWFASTSSLVVEVLNSLLIRISRRLVGFGERIEKSLTSTDEYEEQNMIDYDIDLLSEQDANSDEKRILKGIRKFGDTNVKQVMRSRLDVSGIEISANFHEVLNKAGELRYSRLPVFSRNLDDIKGVLHTKDLIPHLSASMDFDWHELIRKPFFVHEQKLIDDLLQDFRNKRIHFAVVVDEFGGTSGIVTLEDIIEEIIGDIKDEFDDEESANRKIDDFNFIFEGKTMIHDACLAMALPVETFDGVRGDSDSLAGLLLEIAGEFPQVNENLVKGDFTFIPLEISKNRIDKIKVVIRPSRLQD